MLQQGFAVDTSDYDGRTALILAASKGQSAIAAMLLSAGANPSLQDNLGGRYYMVHRIFDLRVTWKENRPTSDPRSCTLRTEME